MQCSGVIGFHKKCIETRLIRVEFTKDLIKELEKVKLSNASIEEILSLIEDMLKFFRNKDREDEMNQVMLI